MPFEARALVPLGDYPLAAYPAFADAAEPELTFFDVAEDSLPTEGLAAALVRRSRRPIWLRLGPQDRDPGTFLVSLANAADFIRAGARAVGVGTELVNLDAIRAGNPGLIKERAKQYLQIVKEARTA